MEDDQRSLKETSKVVGYTRKRIRLSISAPRFHLENNNSSEAIDHTAFFMTGYETFRKKLDDSKINYSPMELPDINQKRIFLQTPKGILLETVFRNE